MLCNQPIDPSTVFTAILFGGQTKPRCVATSNIFFCNYSTRVGTFAQYRNFMKGKSLIFVSKSSGNIDKALLKVSAEFLAKYLFITVFYGQIDMLFEGDLVAAMVREWYFKKHFFRLRN